MPIARSFRPALLAAVLLLTAGAAHGLDDQCLSPSPTLREGKNPYAPIAVRDLTPDEHQMLARLFKLLDGSWKGQAHSFFCRSAVDAGDVEVDQETASARVTVDYYGNLAMEIEFYSEKKKTRRQSRLLLFQNNRRLRIDHDTGAGEVEVNRISESAVAFLYRRILPIGSGSSRREHFLSLAADGRTLIIERPLYIQGKLSSGETWRLTRE